MSYERVEQKDETDKLVTSSKMTLHWLDTIKSEIKQRVPSLDFNESKYWASFRSPETNRNIVYLQPQKSQIRLFVRLNLSYDKNLQQTPSSSNWAEMYPSIFVIRSKNMIKNAIELIVSSYEYDLQK